LAPILGFVGTLSHVHGCDASRKGSGRRLRFHHRRRRLGGLFHVSGTCRMEAAADRDAVVDPDGRVIGVGGLRVADTSVMPVVPRANTDIPTIMVAERLAATAADH
jgi:choline dehydrogenase-like flavoprotein